MKGFLIMLFAFLFLLCFVFFEEYYVRNTSDELAFMISDVQNLNEFEKVKRRWEKEEKRLSWFVNHKELEKITLELESAEEYLKANNENLYKAHIVRVKIKMENLPNY